MPVFKKFAGSVLMQQGEGGYVLGGVVRGVDLYQVLSRLSSRTDPVVDRPTDRQVGQGSWWKERWML